MKCLKTIVINSSLSLYLDPVIWLSLKGVGCKEKRKRIVKYTHRIFVLGFRYFFFQCGLQLQSYQ